MMEYDETQPYLWMVASGVYSCSDCVRGAAEVVPGTCPSHGLCHVASVVGRAIDLFVVILVLLMQELVSVRKKKKTSDYKTLIQIPPGIVKTN